ncbi:MAG: endonuclease/exonuclease/phosphatase family protein [Myxococcota bacterium]
MPDRLRILSANLWGSGGATPEALERVLVAEDVDVACFQELAPEQAEAIASVLQHGQLEPSEDHYGLGIALRAPADFGRLEMQEKPVRTVRLDPKDWPGLGRELCVWNVHVWAPHVLPIPRSLATRRVQIASLMRHLAGVGAEDPLVLVGDFNATPLWPVYRRVASVLRDGPLEVAQRQGRTAAWTWGPWSGAPRMLRIDHAFVQGVHVEDARTLHIEGTDHSGLLVDVTLG